MKPGALQPEVVQDLQEIDHRHLWRIASFGAIYAVSAAIAVAASQRLGGSWIGLAALIPLYVFAGAALHGISLFTHEGVHGALSPRPGWNRAIAIACALPVLQNYSAYKVLHLRHHADTGGGLDPDHYANYSQRNRMLFFMHWARLLVGYPVYIVAIPLMALKQGRLTDRLWTTFESLLLLGIAMGIVLSPIPWPWIVHGWLLPMVCINTMVNIRGMSQHTLLDEPIDSVRGTRTILTHPIVAYFMCNENYHLEHHLYPRVPWYNLPRLHRALRPGLEAERAPFIPSYWAFVKEFAVKSCVLWRGPTWPRTP